MQRFKLMRLLAEKDVCKAKKPRPFAGKYPTRIALAAISGDGKAFRHYLGKPNIAVIQRFLSLPKEHDVVLMEFDRNGLFLVTRRNKVGSRSNDLLLQCYHPFCLGSSQFKHFLGGDNRWTPTRVGGFFFYRRPSLESTKNHLEAIKSCLSGTTLSKNSTAQF